MNSQPLTRDISHIIGIMTHTDCPLLGVLSARRVGTGALWGLVMIAMD